MTPTLEPLGSLPEEDARALDAMARSGGRPSSATATA